MLKFLIGFVVFTAWALWARSVYVCEIRHLCQQEVFVDSSMGTAASLRISRAGEIISGQGLFVYTLASDYLEFSSGERLFLDRVSKYLKPNTQLMLKIRGYYSRSEKDVPAGMYENIGLARAALVRDSLVKYYAVKPRRIWIQAQMLEDTDPEAAKAPDETVGFWLANDTILPTARYDFTNMTFSEKNFKNNGTIFTPQLPFVMYADSLREYSQQNPGHSIVVSVYRTGKAITQQTKAEARAEAVKKYLSRTKGIKNTIVTGTKPQRSTAEAGQSLLIQVQSDL